MKIKWTKVESEIINLVTVGMVLCMFVLAYNLTYNQGKASIYQQSQDNGYSQGYQAAIEKVSPCGEEECFYNNITLTEFIEECKQQPSATSGLGPYVACTPDGEYELCHTFSTKEETREWLDEKMFDKTYKESKLYDCRINPKRYTKEIEEYMKYKEPFDCSERKSPNQRLLCDNFKINIKGDIVYSISMAEGEDFKFVKWDTVNSTCGRLFNYNDPKEDTPDCSHCPFETTVCTKDFCMDGGIPIVLGLTNQTEEDDDIQ